MGQDEQKRVAIYIRVSTLDQAREGYSLAAQERTLRDWCKSHECVVHDLYSDAGISGKDIHHRPDMQRLLHDAADSEFDIVIVWALSRLTRSMLDLYRTWTTLCAHDISLISYTESFDTGTPTGRAMMGMLGIFAQMEREITSERVIAAMAERAIQGKRTCSKVLGYTPEGSDTLTVNHEEAAIVQYIFSKYLEHRSLSAVAELCSLKGYSGKRGKPFRAESIRKILTRPIYAGYYSYNGTLIYGGFEPIIPPKTYNKIQRILGSGKSVDE